MHGLRRVFAAFSYVVVASAPLAAETMTRVDTYGDWTLLTDSETPHLFCFVTSEPKSSAPSDTQRQAPRAYVSAWPKDGIRSEVSFRVGFKLKKSTQGTASVGAGGFKLFGSSDRAFVSDSTQELKLLEAMRKGSTMAVAIASEHGTVTDTYSLSGVAAALQKLQETCF
jgi:invasion protein IalB